MSSHRAPSHHTMADRLARYQQTIALLEQQLWQPPHDDEILKQYQQLFRELEQVEQASRHHFLIVIPVADRPQHLAACLGSILQLCDTFGYGGKQHGRYARVAVLIADDSREQHNIARQRQLAADYHQRGLDCHYFGQDEQLAQLAKLDDSSRVLLHSIIGDTPPDAFFHKGASLTRNIAYLKLSEMVAGRDDTLIYFIDSDQEFQVRVPVQDGDKNRYAINYLYQLDRIFRERDITILTGKVVGDPPVSPAVMAGNLLDDVSAFFTTMATLGAGEPCRFHGQGAQHSDDAAYHDMAELFGFAHKGHAFHYPCDLAGAHDHAACFTNFARQLNRFFDGEHPTRKSYYQHQPLADSIAPARTIYTGNYCFRAAALRYFIPFATLKLRMAGPVLGRIIKSEIGEQFVSANLPMLHKRTVEELGQSEFRPGIQRTQQRVDLSAEFERQFFGDVMLFTMERLTAQGLPASELTAAPIEEAVQQVEARMLHSYTLKHDQIVARLVALKALFNDPRQWWQRSTTLATACTEVGHFIANMEDNFGDRATGYRQIHSGVHRARRRAQIVAAILGYRRDRHAWEAVLAARAQ